MAPPAEVHSQSISVVVPHPARRKVCVRLVLAVAMAAALAPRQADAEPAKAKQVLLVYSHERELAMYTNFDRVLRSRLASGAGFPIEFYTEYLDLIRFDDPGHREKAVEYLRLKYASQSIDMILAVGSLAFDFVLEHGQRIFPDIPIVFTSVNMSHVDELSLDGNVTGIGVRRDLHDTLDLLLKVHPDTTQVFVPVGSTPIERDWAAAARGTLTSYAQRVGIHYVEGLSMEDMLRRLHELPPHSVVLFTTLYYYDAAGQYFLPEETVANISARSNAPLYITDEPFLGSGAVGGVLFDLAATGEMTARIGQRVLRGEKPASIPIETLDPNHAVFDARQLQRWHIARASVPANSIIRFEEVGPWQRYRFYIIAAVSIVLVQAALIAGLIAARVTRRRAEESLRQSHEQIRDLAGRLITAQEAERTRIARELHDDAGQRIASLSIALSRIKRRVRDDPQQVSDALAGLQQELVVLSKDLRLLSHALHPGALEHLGLVKSLQIRCDEVEAESGIPVRLEVAPELGAVPPAAALCLYRVAQEALHNIVKHAQARSARVALARHDGEIAMHIEDDGRGFEAGTAAGHRGLGLMSLDERVRMLGGVLAIATSRETGTSLSVTIPLAEPRAHSTRTR